MNKVCSANQQKHQHKKHQHQKHRITMDMNKVFCALGVASAVVVVARLTFHSVYHQPLFPDTVTCASLVLLLVLVDVERLRPGKGHNFRSLVIQYIVNRLLYFAGIFMSNRLKKLGRDVRKHQRELLQDILKINRETEIAKHFSLHNVKDIEEYRSKMPLTKYKEYDAFASDVSENGSENVFFPGRPDYIALTSGTTSGKSKCFPKSMKVLRQTAGAWLLLSQKCFLDIERNNYLRKWLVVRANPKTRYCNGGIKTGPISGIGSNFSLNPYVVPDITNDLSNEEDVIYLNLVFGLKSCDICNLFFSTAQMALLFFQTLERRWVEICDDIERGEFTREFGVPDHVREALSQGLNGADPDRANFLRQEIQKGFNGIVPRVWPECPGLFCLATGAFQLQQF